MLAGTVDGGDVGGLEVVVPPDAGDPDFVVVVALDCDDPPHAALSASAASPNTTRRRSTIEDGSTPSTSAQPSCAPPAATPAVQDDARQGSFDRSENYVTMDEEAGEPNKPRKGGVLVLVSFGLLMLAVVLRVVSVFVGGLTVLYLSIASSAGAAITLMLAVRGTKRDGVRVRDERPVARPRQARPLWLRVGGRCIGALVCLSGLVSIAGRNEVKSHEVTCGSFSEALHSHVGNCAGNARMSLFGLVILAIGFIVLTVSVVRLLRGAGAARTPWSESSRGLNIL